MLHKLKTKKLHQLFIRHRKAIKSIGLIESLESLGLLESLESLESIISLESIV